VTRPPGWRIGAPYPRPSNPIVIGNIHWFLRFAAFILLERSRPRIGDLDQAIDETVL
jgi:hypothetical protein